MPGFRTLMVDVDGVIVVRPDDRRWDADLQADLGVDPADLQSAFFTPHWPAIILGQARIEDRLPTALSRIAPGLSAEDLIAYWFEKDSVLNQPLLDDLADLRAAGVPMHLATVQEHRRAGYLWDVLRLCDRFDGLLHSALIGHAKPDPAYFTAVAGRLKASPGDLLLLDDSPRNVAAAIASGWQARLWDGSAPLADVLAPEG